MTSCEYLNLSVWVRNQELGDDSGMAKLNLNFLVKPGHEHGVTTTVPLLQLRLFYLTFLLAQIPLSPGALSLELMLLYSTVPFNDRVISTELDLGDSSKSSSVLHIQPRYSGCCKAGHVIQACHD